MTPELDDGTNVPEWDEKELVIAKNPGLITLDDGTEIFIPEEERSLLLYPTKESLYDALGYRKVPLFWDGFSASSEKVGGMDDTGRVWITQHGKFLADVSDKYHLIPNELVSQAGDAIAKRVGANLWKHKQTETRMYRYYLCPQEKIGPNRELNPGFLLVNSMDGSTSARFQAFMYRAVCENGMIFGKQMVGTIWARHTQNFEVNFQDWMKASLVILQNAREIATAQEKWPSISMNSPEGKAIVERLKKMKVPNKFRPDYLKIPGERLKEEEIPPVPDISLWEVYNAITANLTRPPGKMVVQESSIVDLQISLHKALAPLLVVA